eukprot:NODE_706_length_4978_cov_0.203730.p1 type:complete len:322 gc:universal NODE_706_length_4978_cov_0.203730:2532-3497(+)
MESVDQFAFAVLGINVLLFFIGILKSFFTFKNKSTVPYLTILCGLCCTITSTMLSFGAAYWDPDHAPTFVLLDTFFYTQMVQYTLWAYYYRLKTLPKFNQYDNYIFFIPFVVGIFQVPEAVYYNLASRNDEYEFIMGVTGTLSGMAIIFCEFIMYFVLIKKLLAFIQTENGMWLAKVTITLMILVLLDLSEIVFYFVDSRASSIFYSLSFNVRLNAVILFFGDLVDFVQSGKSWRSYQQTPMNSSSAEIGATSDSGARNVGDLKDTASQFIRKNLSKKNLTILESKSESNLIQNESKGESTFRNSSLSFAIDASLENSTKQ